MKLWIIILIVALVLYGCAKSGNIENQVNVVKGTTGALTDSAKDIYNKAAGTTSTETVTNPDTGSNP